MQLDIYEQLRRKAKAMRAQAVKDAHERYRLAIRNINTLHALIGEGRHTTPVQRQRRSPEGTPFPKLKTLEAAEVVLMEGKPMRIMELTCEVQRRGHRTNDSRRLVLRAIKSAFSYHKDRFIRDENLYWTVI